jgi:PGF-CTERM protein
MTDRMRQNVRSAAFAVVFFVVLGVVAATLFSAPAAANHDSDLNYTVTLPSDSDHRPGDQNEQNASIQHRAVGADALAAVAPNGFETFDYLEIGNPAIDFSGCSSSNTAVLGIDRGNNNTGTRVDTDLLKSLKQSTFTEDAIKVDFYEEEDFGGDPTYLNPEDAIVAVQGEGSSGGPCYTMPSDPGWYQITGILEGTTSDGEAVTVEGGSHYFPICEGCGDEETAREKLGPPPSQEGGSDAATATPTPEPVDDTATPTPTPEPADDTATPTPTPEPVDDTATPTPTPEPADDSGSESNGDNGGSAANDPGTPTPGAGPGFGPAIAVLALLASALLVNRRR